MKKRLRNKKEKQDLQEAFKALVDFDPVPQEPTAADIITDEDLRYWTMLDVPIPRVRKVNWDNGL
jgi:hypothetical protein